MKIVSIKLLEAGFVSGTGSINSPCRVFPGFIFNTEKLV